jgi:putative ABC transport system permease protein
MPPDFQYPGQTEIWTPMAFRPGEKTIRGGHYINVIGRLKQGVTFAQAKSNMEGIVGQLSKQYPNTNGGWGVNPKTLLDAVVGNIKPQLYILLGAVAFVLLIACANVANLLLAKASTRHREIAIRTALGAGRVRLIRQLLTESVIMAIAGGALGLLLAYWGVRVLVSISPDTIPRSKTIGLDMQALGFTLAISLITGILFGLVPALQASKPNLNNTLKEGGRGGSAGAAQRYIRNSLVVSEIALSLILLIGAGLLIRSFIRLREVDPGFKTEGVLTMQVTLPRAKYGDEPRQIAFTQQLLQRIKTVPGIESSAITTTVPMLGGSIYGFTFEGDAALAPQDVPSAEYFSVSADYFQTMGVRLLKGRVFTEYDSATANKVAIINEAMVRKYFPNEDPVGRRLNITNGYKDSREIVGIVGDVKSNGVDSNTASQMYVPLLQEPDTGLYLAIRSANNPIGLVGAIRSQVQVVDPIQPIANIKTMDEIMAASIGPRRLTMVLLGIFAAVALILAAVGIYGVMSYSVTQRTQEIGIRMALGARVLDVLKMVIGQGMLLTLAGLILGLVGAFGLGWFIQSLLFGVSSRDPMTFFGISGLLALVAFLAVYLPARRAAKTDPIIALRYD